MASTYKALVVEDSPAMRQLIVHALQRIKDLSISQAGDGAQGLKKLRQEKFDILLTDINMPIMDGLKLVSLTRQDANHKGIPIVVITTESAQADRQRALDLGATAYITKPIQASNVLSCVRKLLENVSVQGGQSP
jgi:two-component system chemotaxis response regulator CheY